MSIMHDFNPLILKKWRSPGPIPWDTLRRVFEGAFRIKLGIGKRNVKWVFKRGKATRAEAAARQRVVDTAKVFEPGVVPKARVVRDVSI